MGKRKTQKSEYLLIFILVCLFDLIEAKSKGGGGFFILTGFGVWGTVITIISILCCIGCCLIPLCCSEEEEQGTQLQQVVTSRQGGHTSRGFSGSYNEGYTGSGG